MRWLQTEYLLKGVYLGLVLYAALQEAALPSPEGWQALGLSALFTLVGLVLALLFAGVLKLRQGYHINGKFVAFTLFLLLESPTLAYGGILGGALASIAYNYSVLGTLAADQLPTLDALRVPVLGGAALAGFAFGLLHQVKHQLARAALIIALAGGILAAGLSWLGAVNISFLGEHVQPYLGLKDTAVFAAGLLVGVPFFYLLTFAGQEEESEVEIGAMCLTLGVSLGILNNSDLLPTWARGSGSLAFFLPLLLFFGYTFYVLPSLRVLKHAFRGYSFTRVGKYRRALLSFRRALQLDPNNRLARDGFWEVHRSLDLNLLTNDSQVLPLLDLDLCLDRAGSLLINGKPSPAALAEAYRLLELVLTLQPERRPQVEYWRSVALTHDRQYDQAAQALERILDPNRFGADNPSRRAVLLAAWQLALVAHPELTRRVGVPQLALPGRRMEAIAAVERALAEAPDDPSARALRKLLYENLTEADYDSYAGHGVAAPFIDHAYLQQLGIALINDDARWQRGGEFLRLSARGQPALGPTLFVQIARANQRAGHVDQARHNYELARRAGQSVGPGNLADAERQAYFSTVKLLGDEALKAGDTDAAIENYQLYSESERSGIETLRTLAELYERRGDALAALWATDRALIYNASDADLLARKDKYYYSVTPEQLQARLDQVKTGFDFDYCLQKSRFILERYNDLEWLDVALHLTTLAQVVKPESLAAKVLLARVRLRLGEREEAMKLLEGVRAAGPEKLSGDEEEAWFQGCQLLGDLYLEMSRPDLAVPCLSDFRKSSKSGARTLFKLGQAHEQLGDLARAKRCYEQVTAYDGNPLVPEAYEAMQRLGR
jgi:tetratricopeptide (TPR) repeat protein